MGLFVLITLLVVTLYTWQAVKFNFWKKRGVPYINPWFFGFSFEFIFSLKPIVEIANDFYETFRESRYGGIFLMWKPIMLVTDPELIEAILVKDFSSFRNRGVVDDFDLNPLSKHLVYLKDEPWKYLRKKLTPVFSSGKLKGMYDELNKSSDTLVERLSETFEAKSVTSEYAADVIASCAYGLSNNDVQEKLTLVNLHNNVEFFQGSLFMKITNVLLWCLPQYLHKFLRYKQLPQNIIDSFINTIRNTIKYREENNIVRNDFLHLMKELKKKDVQEAKEHPEIEKPIIFDEQVLTSNAYVFFTAGFETISSTLSFALYELSVNQDVQEKLYADLKSTINLHKGELTFKSINSSTYLDFTVSETLRKHTPIPFIPREVRKPYQIPGTDTVLPCGTHVLILPHSIHHDARYYPNPEKFIPERFDEGNHIKKCTYLPFGDGPRVCLGRRFALLEIKVALTKIILNYKVSLNKKTSFPLKYSKKTIFLNPEIGIWIDIEKRK